MNAITVPHDPAKLAEQADILRQCCDTYRQAAQEGLQAIFRGGEALIKAKALCGHGEWLPWLANNFPFDARTAQRWTRIAENRALIESKYDTVSYLTEREALQLLVMPKLKLKPSPRTVDDRIAKLQSEVAALKAEKTRWKRAASKSRAADLQREVDSLMKAVHDAGYSVRGVGTDHCKLTKKASAPTWEGEVEDANVVEEVKS